MGRSSESSVDKSPNKSISEGCEPPRKFVFSCLLMLEEVVSCGLPWMLFFVEFHDRRQQKILTEMIVGPAWRIISFHVEAKGSCLFGAVTSGSGACWQENWLTTDSRGGPVTNHLKNDPVLLFSNFFLFRLKYWAFPHRNDRRTGLKNHKLPCRGEGILSFWCRHFWKRGLLTRKLTDYR